MLGGIVARTIHDAGGVDDGDLAAALVRDVDTVDDQVIVRLVDDVHARQAVRDLDLPVTGAEDLAGEDHPSALRHYVVDHDRALLRIEMRLDRDAVAEGHARHRVAVVADQ